MFIYFEISFVQNFGWNTKAEFLYIYTTILSSPFLLIMHKCIILTKIDFWIPEIFQTNV